METEDSLARIQALDPTSSFIVQAPAGSGKTELLTQRYLVLLSHVNSTEEIIALTFTKKAAAEMQNRIIKAIEYASKNNHPPIEEHKIQTYNLAKKALEHSQNQGWNLLKNPNQLKIQTIDSFCHWLCQKMLLENIENNGGLLGITETQCQMIYKQAVDNLVANLQTQSEYYDSFIYVFESLENNLEHFTDLMVDLLNKREQWLPVIFNDVLNNRDLLQNAHQIVMKWHIKNFNDWLSQYCSDLHIFYPLLPNASTGLSLELASIENWKTIINILFTENASIRKRNTAAIKQYPAILLLLSRLRDIDGDNLPAANVIKIIKLINKFDFDEDQWLFLQHTITLMKTAVGYLRLLFSQRNKVDFSEVSIRASAALGDDHAPTDLTLYLDHQIKHLLIDEFQDTSLIQYNIFCKLVGQWQQGDGRSMFIVGDPMQSIYRFRQAEVTLFLHVRDQGIANIKPKPLYLHANFRSNNDIVNWFNQTFVSVFPAHDLHHYGAIKYNHSESTNDIRSANPVNFFTFFDDLNEAHYIVNQIIDIKKHSPCATIAILGRTRGSLKPTKSILDYYNIISNKYDLESLWSNSDIKMLVSLLLVLNNKQDNYAWTALLKSALFGLKFSHIEVLLNHKDHFTLSTSALTSLPYKKLSAFIVWSKNIKLFQKRQSIIVRFFTRC